MHLKYVITLEMSQTPFIISPDVIKEEEEPVDFDLEYIIEEKPPTKELREYMKLNLATIINEDDMLFQKNEDGEKKPKKKKKINI